MNAPLNRSPALLCLFDERISWCEMHTMELWSVDRKLEHVDFGCCCCERRRQGEAKLIDTYHGFNITFHARPPNKASKVGGGSLVVNKGRDDTQTDHQI